MFNFSISLRALVYLRQISRALVRANELTELKLSIEHPAEYKSRIRAKQKGVSKVGEISVAKVEDWNKNYERLHPRTNEED